MIDEGIKARQGLFDAMADKLEQIQKAREDLRKLLRDENGERGKSSAKAG